MDRFRTSRSSDDVLATGRGDDFILPSRGAALTRCLDGLVDGPILITGDAGIGKSWLAGRVAAVSTRTRRWISVDLAPSIGPESLIRTIGHRLGLEATSADRLTLGDALADESADGRHWGLILDEAHLATVEVLEEVRVLSNRLGRADGFAAIVIVGQTLLRRRLSTRPLSGLSARIAARVQLSPIDADEAGVLVDRVTPGRAIDSLSLERCHRDASGNPGRLLVLAALHSDPTPGPLSPPASRRLSTSTWVAPQPEPRVEAKLDPDPAESSSPDTTSGSTSSEPTAMDLLEPGTVDATPFVPFQLRNPLTSGGLPDDVGEGIIEVGWQGDEDEPDDDDEPTDEPAHDDVISEEAAIERRPDVECCSATERLADHYAALQAWEEWSRNQGGIRRRGNLGRPPSSPAQRRRRWSPMKPCRLRRKSPVRRALSGQEASLSESPSERRGNNNSRRIASSSRAFGRVVIRRAESLDAALSAGSRLRQMARHLPVHGADSASLARSLRKATISGFRL